MWSSGPAQPQGAPASDKSAAEGAGGGLVEEFESALPRLRKLLVGAAKEDFTVEGAPFLTEKQWLVFVFFKSFTYIHPYVLFWVPILI